MGKFKRQQKARQRTSYKEQRKLVYSKLVEFAEMVLDTGNPVLYPTVSNAAIVPGLLGRLKAEYPGLSWQWHEEAFSLFVAENGKTPQTLQSAAIAG